MTVALSTFSDLACEEKAAAKDSLPILPGGRVDDHAIPVVSGKIGAGSYEDPAEEKRMAKGKGKTGR